MPVVDTRDVRITRAVVLKIVRRAMEQPHELLRELDNDIKKEFDKLLQKETF